MQILRAEVLGMCFGVRDALKIIAGVDAPERVTIHGELVHNELVLTQLGARGFHMVGEEDRQDIPPTDTVLITAHGVSQRERRRLADAGKMLIDTTCPLVTRAHQAAQKLNEQGFHILLIGKRGHVEVQGVIEDLDSYDVIQNESEVRTYPHARLGILCQTTTPTRLAQRVRVAIADKNPHAEIRFADTICHPTKDHQAALDALIDEVEVMVVVGGRNSNNTRELAARCRERGIEAYHVQGAAGLDPAWFDGVAHVGLTAGTSTLDVTIDEVHQALLAIAERSSRGAGVPPASIAVA